MPRSFRHLDLSERVAFETQLSLGVRPAGIAASLRRARSTISREIGRNGWRANYAKGSKREATAVWQPSKSACIGW